MSGQRTMEMGPYTRKIQNGLDISLELGVYMVAVNIGTDQPPVRWPKRIPAFKVYSMELRVPKLILN